MQRIILTILGLLCLVPVMAQVSFGESSLFNDDWAFLLDDKAEYKDSGYDDSGWRRLSLPHDWSIEGEPSVEWASCMGYLPTGVGWYRKHFTIADSLPLHFIFFEGIYNRSEVYLNGHLLGKRPNGYVSFMFELTPYIHDGDNVLAVRVDHSRNADSRWYTGSGIYRDVYLISSGKVHFAQWGVDYVYDPDAKAIHIRAVTEGADRPLVRRASLLDGNKVVAIAEKRSDRIDLCLDELQSLKLWSVDNPYLYTIRVELLDGSAIIDKTDIRAGFRTLAFDANKGFALNGEWMKVKGVCLHHDAGVLGAAVPKDVWHRRLLALKAMGCNAIRMSHNPQAPCMYDLCDELGFLVMDEASDEWEFPKRKWKQGWNKGAPGYDGSYDFFEEWIDRDVTDMVRRDRNHPSVFLWSIGNEVDYPNDPYSHPILDGKNSKINQPMFGGYKPESPNAERIGKIAKRLAACVRKVDTSRPVTGALAGVVMSNETDYPQAVDVVGYNYTEDRYEQDHSAYPDRIIYGSETHSSPKAWKAVSDNEFIFGQFIWTGYDYLGESGAWPSRGLGTGLIDFAGFLKPQGEMQKAMWAGEDYLALRKKRHTHKQQSGIDESLLCLPANSLRITDVTIDKASPVHQLLIEALDKDGNYLPYADDMVICSVKTKVTVVLGLENADNRDMSAPKAMVKKLNHGRMLAYIRGDVSDVVFTLQQQRQGVFCPR